MITPFNRAELLITYDFNRLSRVRDALAGAGIDYAYRFKDLGSPTFGGTRSRSGTFGMNQEVRTEYKLYVHKRDLEHAQAVIRGV